MHPLEKFTYCPVCGSKHFGEHNFKSKKCDNCGFTYYQNPSAATAAFIVNGRGELLVERRGKEPAKGTLDLPGGFIDNDETAEEGVAREMVDIVDPYLTHRLSGEPVELLVKMVEHGSRCGEPEGIEAARERCREALMRLDPAVARFLNPQTYPVGLEPGLAELRSRLALEERAESGRPTA